MTHRLEFPRGKGVRTDMIGFLVSRIVKDAQEGTNSCGLITWGEVTYRVKIQKVRYREKFWQFWRPRQ